MKRNKPTRKKGRGRPKGSYNRIVIKRSYVKRFNLKCKKCKQNYAVRTTSPELYTPKVRKNWVCVICK